MFLFIIALASIIAQSSSFPCQVSSRTVQLNSSYQKYLTANRIAISQQPTIIQIYQSLTNIEDYSISLDINSSIFINNQPKCIKSTIQQIYNANNDIWMCFDQFYQLSCNQAWQLVTKCGTFVQMHRPFDPEVLISLNLEDASWINDYIGERMTNLGVKQICAGLYHLWFIYYSRQGKFLKRVRTIYINYPSCQC